MLTENVYNTNVSFQSGAKIWDLSKDYLDSKNLTHFSYVRIYKNKNVFVLTTHPEVSEDFFRLEFYKKIKYEKSTMDLNSSALLWMALGPEDMGLINHIKDYHNLSNGIVLSKSYADYYEYTYFAATPENKAANNYYLANLDDLYNFLFYFKEKAKDLILEGHHSPIHLSDYNPNIEISPEYQFTELKRNIRIEDPMFKKLYYSTDLGQSISKREFQCLGEMAAGKRVKEIAKVLDLAPRSIRYYIENLKEKTQLSSHQQLVDFYYSLF